MNIKNKKTGESVFIGQAAMLDLTLADLKWSKDDCVIETSDYEKKEMVRSHIETVAEPMTREGVISDVSAVLVVGLAQTIKAIASGKDLAEVKATIAGLQPFADAVLSQLATPADLKNPGAAIEAGKVVMPYLVKGDAAKVVKDMGKLANGVSAALLAARAG
jgi:hypothetical protein